MPGAGMSLAVALLAAFGGCQAWTVTVRSDDVAFMLQRDLSQGLDDADTKNFAVGDHVLVSLEGYTDPVKGSIIQKNEDGTYDVHMWVGNLRTRARRNLPVEILADAKPQEREEADKILRVQQEQSIIAEERMAAAKQHEYDEMLAAEKAEEAKKEAEAYYKDHKDEIDRKTANEARTAAMAKAREMHKLAKQREQHKAQQKADEEFEKHYVKINVVGRHKKTAVYKHGRRQAFEDFMGEVCEKFKLKLSDTLFYYKGDVIKPTDTPNALHMYDATADIVLGLHRHTQ